MNRAKLEVFAGLHEKVAQHNSVLRDRQTMLDSTRENFANDYRMILERAGTGVT